MTKELRDTITMRLLFGVNALWVTYVFTGELRKAGYMSLVLMSVNTVVYYIWQRSKA